VLALWTSGILDQMFTWLEQNVIAPLQDVTAALDAWTVADVFPFIERHPLAGWLWVGFVIGMVLQIRARRRA
jgi:hypothetical protein